MSVEGTPRPLPVPFMVAATQNPVEYEGTYLLPEAQLDRFLLKLTVALPERADEIGILARHAAGFDPRDLAAAGIRPVAGPGDLAAARQAAARVRLAPEIAGYIVDICRATRVSPSLQLGVSPRGAHRAAGQQPGLGLAVRPRLRHARRRQGAGPADLPAPDSAAARGRAGGGHAPTACSRACSARSRCRGDRVALTGRAALAALAGALVVLALRTPLALLAVDALILAAIGADVALAAPVRPLGVRRSGDRRILLGQAGTVTVTIANRRPPAAARPSSGTPGGRAPRPGPGRRR